jgi:hypothetical protein
MENSLRRVDWGHVTFVLFIAGSVSWYFLDAYTASSSIKNLILIAPASALALVLCVTLLIQDARKAFATPSDVPKPATASDKSAAAGEDKEEKQRGTWRAVAFIVAFGFYIGLLEVVGYDVATWLFIAATLILNGERRPWMILGFSMVFGSLAVWLFGLLLPYPMLTLVVPN